MARKQGKNKSLMDFIKQGVRKEELETSGEALSNKSSDYIDEITRFIIEASNTESRSKTGTEGREVENVGKNDVSDFPRDVIDRLLSRSIDERINCSQSGACDDNRMVSQIFIDDLGIPRQRGYLKTTRLPVYLDFIVEKAVVKQILPNTYKVETDRGSIALVPEDFLCELHNRYGVILLNYDKCRDYRKDLQGFTKDSGAC